MKKLISIVIPCFNEEEVISKSFEILINSLNQINKYNFEIIYIDDGSTDKTFEYMLNLKKIDNRIRVLRFSRNFGHQLAVSAGIDFAKGDAVVLIDSDMQDPPELIIDMIGLWQKGYQVVYGVRKNRDGETLFKLITAKIFYRVLNLMSSIKIPLDVGDFRLIDRSVANILSKMPESHRFVRGMVSWTGFKQVAMPYYRKRRIAGKTKYNLTKMFNFALDGFFSFSNIPLRLASLFGLFVSALSFIGIIYALIMRIFTNDWVTGWTLLFIAVLFLGGIQLIFLGILGEYIGRIYNESKQRPNYIISYDSDEN